MHDDTKHDWATDGIQVWPRNDLREHLDTECWCEPFYEEKGILVHNSLDKREYYEPDSMYMKRSLN